MKVVSNVIHFDFHEYPDEDFQSEMVDFFKHRLEEQGRAGSTRWVAVSCMFAALATAAEETPIPNTKLPPAEELELREKIFTSALQDFAERKYGYRVVDDAYFEKIKAAIMEDIWKRRG